MTRLAVSSVLFVALLSACGDNHSTPDAAFVTDGPGDGGTSATPFVVAVAGDFTPGDPGVLSLLDPVSDLVRANAVAGVVGDDPFIRHYGGNLYIINRSDGDNVTVLNASTLALIAQLSTGSASNPQDVAVVGTKLYVPALGTAGVVTVDTGSGSAAPDIIDLSALDPADGKPDCVSAYLVGTELFVACDLLDATSTPRGPGVVAVIDTTTDTFESAKTITLPFANPQNMIIESPTDSMFAGDLLIPTVPSFTDYTMGCIARVTPGTTPEAHGCAISNMDLAGFVSHEEVATGSAGSETLWMAVTSYSADFSNTYGQLRPYDLKAGTLGAVVSSTSELISDVTACANGDVIASDATAGSAGLRVFDGSTELTTKALPIGLPPSDGNGLVCYTNSL